MIDNQKASDKLEREKYLKPLKGWLYKLEPALLFTQWKRLYFNLEGDKLMYYKTDKDLEHNGVIELRDVKSIILKASISSKPARDEREHFQFDLQTTNKIYNLSAENEEDFKTWTTGLSAWIHYFQEEWFVAHEGDEKNDAQTNVMSPKETELALQITNSEKGNQKTLKDYYRMKSRSSRKDLTPNVTTPTTTTTTTTTTSTLKSSNETTQNHITSQEFKDKMAALERLVQEQREEIELLRKKQEAREAEWKQYKDQMLEQSKTKERSFNFLLNAKEQQIEKLKKEKFDALAQLKDLEELKNENKIMKTEVAELKKKLKEAELEIIDRREKEMQQKEQIIDFGLVNESLKRQKILEDTLTKVKEQLFYVLATQCNLSTKNNEIGHLYEKALKEQVPFEQYQEWIMQNAHEDEREAIL